MPLVKGKKASTGKGFSDNVKREMHEGKPQKQAVAIAYAVAKKKIGEKKKTAAKKKVAKKVVKKAMKKGK